MFSIRKVGVFCVTTATNRRSVSTRYLSSNAKREKYLEKKKNMMQRFEKLANKQKGLPEFPQLLRVLYKQAHPDLIRASNPEYASVNDQSLQLLNGVLSSAKALNEFPPQIKQKIPFYIRQQSSNEYTLVELNIITPGGDCRHALQRCFETFFDAAGIHSGSFTWGKDYFPAEYEDTVEENDNGMFR